MDQSVIWVSVAIAAVIAIGVAWVVMARRRSVRLQERFGSEYTQAVKEQGTVQKAEAVLEARARRVQALEIRPLSSEDAARFSNTWRRLQAEFVDHPARAVTEADRLLGEVMTMRGYPVGDFDQRVADISVDHPDVVMNYRAARDIAVQHARGEASTEDLRQAMVHHRALFEDLLETRDVGRDSELHDPASGRSRR